MPIRDMLVSYDVEINKLREKINKDSVSVKSDLTKLIDKLLMEKLMKYDRDPLPMDIFTIKIADLEYRSTLIEHKPFRDSADIHFQERLLTKELTYLDRLDSIASKLTAEDIEKEAEDYAHFITNTYNNTVILKSYVKALKEYADREKRKADLELTEVKNSLRWIVSGSDSIPASFDAVSRAYKPLVMAEEKYTAGLHYKDSVEVSGYFATIVPTRKPDVNVTFLVDKNDFSLSDSETLKGMVYSDTGGHLYFVVLYNEKKSDSNKVAATVAKIYRSDGLAWSENYQLGFVPTELLFKPETGELTLKGDDQQIIVDKNGKSKELRTN